MSNLCKISGKASLSFILGLLSPFLLVLAGLPALLLGYLGLRDINQSDGAYRGRALALCGMALGGISILLTLLGLGALALVQVREKANRVVCQDRLKQLGLAANQYADKNGAFPPGTLPQPDLPPERRLSWLAALLPYLGKGQPQADKQDSWDKLYDKIDRHKAWDDAANREAVNTPVLWYRCPSAGGQSAAAAPGITTYIGMAGVGADAAKLPVDDPLAGVFGYDRRVRLADLTKGTGQTMLAGETAKDNGPWAAGGSASVRGLDRNDLPYIGPDRPWGGLHPGGLNVLCADGRVAFLAQSIDPEIFERLTLIHASK